MLRVCVAGVTGWTGREVALGVLDAEDMALAGAVARLVQPRQADPALVVLGRSLELPGQAIEGGAMRVAAAVKVEALVPGLSGSQVWMLISGE